MSTRTPPSLAWLIDKRARLAGRIENATKVIDAARKLEIKRVKMRADLAAIDRALEMHEIRVDVECIIPIAPIERRIRLPYGILTKTLLQFLRESGEPLSIDALTMMLINRCVNVQEGASDPSGHQLAFKKLRLSVRYRLKNLASNGVISRAPCPHGSKGPCWTLPTFLLGD